LLERIRQQYAEKVAPGVHDKKDAARAWAAGGRIRRWRWEGWICGYEQSALRLR